MYVLLEKAEVFRLRTQDSRFRRNDNEGRGWIPLPYQVYGTSLHRDGEEKSGRFFLKACIKKSISYAIITLNGILFLARVDNICFETFITA